MLLSTRPDEYIGELEEWHKAESALKIALDDSGQEWSLNEGDGAFYGPKIDILLKDFSGKEHQAATIQLDFQLPIRFNLGYRGDDDDKTHRPVMIHRAVFGSFERFLAILMENTQGKWPFWLNPRQAVILPIAERHVKYARKIAETISGVSSYKEKIAPLEAPTFYVDIDDRAESLGARIRNSVQKGYGYILVVGDNELKNETVSIRERSGKAITSTSEDVYHAFVRKASNYE